MDSSGSPFAMITAYKLSNNRLGRSCLIARPFHLPQTPLLLLWSFIHSCSFSSSSSASQYSAAAAGKVGCIALGTKIGIFRCGSWVYSVVLKTSRSSVLSCHGAVRCCTEQTVQSAYSRDSTGRLDKDNVPHTKSVRTIPVFFSRDFVGTGPWTMDHKSSWSPWNLMDLIHRSIALLTLLLYWSWRFRPGHFFVSETVLCCFGNSMMSHGISFYTALLFALLASSFQKWMRQRRNVNKKKLVDKNCMGVDRAQQNFYGRRNLAAELTEVMQTHTGDRGGGWSNRGLTVLKKNCVKKPVSVWIYCSCSDFGFRNCCSCSSSCSCSCSDYVLRKQKDREDYYYLSSSFPGSYSYSGCKGKESVKPAVFFRA